MRSRKKTTRMEHLTGDEIHQKLADGLTIWELRQGLGTPSQQAAFQEWEWRRCAEDFIYFIETYGWIIMKDGTIQRWKLWPFQRKLAHDWMKHVSCVAVKARQLGVTSFSAHFALWEIIFKEAAKWTILSSSEEKAKDIISRIQATKDRLPRWMIERAQSRNKGDSQFVKKRDKSDALTRISFGLSEMKIVTSTPKSIQGAIGNFILDEFTLHTDQKRKIHMLLPAMEGGGMGIVIANGNGEDEFYHLYMRAKEGKNRFKPYFFSWRDDPNRDEEWYKRALEEFLLDPNNSDFDESVFRAMYPSNEREAFYLSGNSRFRIPVLDAISERIEERLAVSKPLKGELIGDLDSDRVEFTESKRGLWTIYELPRRGEVYAIGVDPCGGTAGGDYGVVQVGRVLGEEKVRQVAVFRARIEPSLLAAEAIKAGTFYNMAEINVEANNHGVLVIDRLKDSYYNLYFRKKLHKFAQTDADTVGYWMDAQSKKYIIDQLAEWIHLGNIEINDKETVKELSRYEVRDNGTTAAAPGAHDDMVMALALMVECAKDTVYVSLHEQPLVVSPWEVEYEYY